VAALRQADLAATLDFLREAEGVTGPAPFTPELLGRLGELVPCDAGPAFCELDRLRQRLIAETSSDGRVAGHPDDEPSDYWRLRHEHPVCWHQEQTGDFSARKVSDFTTLRELRRREIWEQRFRQLPYELGVGLPAPPWHTKVFVFHRRGRDFQERDRALLDLLRPHFVHLWESATTRRLADGLAAGAESQGELVVLDAAGAVAYATARAHRLLDEYFDHPPGARLPGAIDDWLRRDRRRLDGDSISPPAQPLTVERDRRRLVVRRATGNAWSLLLTEEMVPAAGSRPLSFREWQVLGLVDEGKSNAEIGVALWISPGTVRTHLENIYAKLGVRSRNAAVARARELKRVETA
jgi:DNA-binding CsgD family transcriptional regulator